MGQPGDEMIARAMGPAKIGESVSVLRRQNEELRRAVEELAVLNELALEIGSTHELNVIMRRIVHRALHVVGAQQGVITIVDPESPDAAHRTLVRTRADSDGSDALHPPVSVLGWMQIHRSSIALDVRHPDPRFNGITWPDAVRTVLAVPLLVRSQLIGMITLYNKTGKDGFSDDDRRLLSIIASQSAQVIENARLLEEEKVHMRVQEELRLARRMQESLLPPAPPALPGYDIAGMSLPAREVGGDYFDYIPLSDGQWALAVGDVVGKGLPAALLMANLQATLRGHLAAAGAVSECLSRVNDQLHRSTRPETFASLFLGYLDTGAGIVTYASAGHNRPILRRCDGSIQQLEVGGLVLGLRPGLIYDEGRTEIGVGDTLLIYSDGLTEAMSPEREEFDERRVFEVLGHADRFSAFELQYELLKAVDAHTNGAGAADDVTMIIIHRTE
jgi:phosphoserine phosphatase RsbU/P